MYTENHNHFRSTYSEAITTNVISTELENTPAMNVPPCWPIKLLVTELERQSEDIKF